ncbi:hypothetical protein Atai01_08330 [Amycolatopsis taiwanensis]|uniref:Uncharacterized protein n=1 Tax=Amycolatopsis taiwanensis TaxID=342230 RepID=A0A9W6QV99_9PSEU|nr:hypothetical protein Atai01_08330 [Amycolatopsis taiwanensis]
MPTAGISSSNTETAAPSGTTPSLSSSAARVPVDQPLLADELNEADTTSGRCTTNAAIATPMIARLPSTVRCVRRAGAGNDALWSIPPLKTKNRCRRVCSFRYTGDTRRFPAGSSIRFYCEDANADDAPAEPSTFPLGLAGFGDDFSGVRRFADRDHKNITQWHVYDAPGGTTPRTWNRSW